MHTSTKLAIGIGAAALLALTAGTAFVSWGLHLYESEVCAYLTVSPVVAARLGKPSSCEKLFFESGEIDDVDTFAFDIAGPKGKGRVFVQSTSTGRGGVEEYQGILLVVDREEVLVEGKRPPVPPQGSSTLGAVPTPACTCKAGDPLCSCY